MINNITPLLDGGTLIIDTTNGRFFIDCEIGTKTPYRITKPSRVEGNPNQVALKTEVDSLMGDLKDYLSKNEQMKYIGDYISGIEKTSNQYPYVFIK